MEKALKEVQELRADNKELVDINVELHHELEKGNHAVEEAAEMICELESEVEGLETISANSPSLVSDSGNTGNSSTPDTKAATFEQESASSMTTTASTELMVLANPQIDHTLARTALRPEAELTAANALLSLCFGIDHHDPLLNREDTRSAEFDTVTLSPAGPGIPSETKFDHIYEDSVGLMMNGLMAGESSGSASGEKEGEQQSVATGDSWLQVRIPDSMISQSVKPVRHHAAHDIHFPSIDEVLETGGTFNKGATLNTGAVLKTDGDLETDKDLEASEMVETSQVLETGEDIWLNIAQDLKTTPVAEQKVDSGPHVVEAPALEHQTLQVPGKVPRGSASRWRLPGFRGLPRRVGKFTSKLFRRSA